MSRSFSSNRLKDDFLLNGVSGFSRWTWVWRGSVRGYESRGRVSRDPCGVSALRLAFGQAPGGWLSIPACQVRARCLGHGVSIGVCVP